MDEATIWRVKLAARIHDPAEKALVLLRDPAGHEGGSIVGLGRQLGFATRMLRQADGSEAERLDLPREIRELVEAADHWAAAADRPQFPRDAERRYAPWTQVRFAEQPRLMHPISGEWLDLGTLKDIDVGAIKEVSLAHLEGLLAMLGEDASDEQRALALWRFASRPPDGRIGALWELLPADTRVPDHTIWSHLDLTAAFATVFALDPERRPALLTVSFGPVQPFIARGRTTSDLWAGSHLLSCIAWEGMRVIAERLGPECVLLPQLRGVPLVDLWLRDERGLPDALFEDCEWRRSASDHNPLFSAALPNRFLALVPAAEARALAAQITARVRQWVRDEARAMLRMVFAALDDLPDDPGYPCWSQLERQLAGFPEVRWAAADWPAPAGEKAGAALPALDDRLGAFYPGGEAPEVLSEPLRSVLSADIEFEGIRFWQANPAALYPAVHELAERAAAAARTRCPFAQLEQHGFRDSLTGEEEWLCTGEAELDLPPGERERTLWARLAARRPAWVRKGEHLGALSMLQRLWPSRFTRRLAELHGIGGEGGPRRHVVSTHTMALARSLEALIAQRDLAGKEARSELLERVERERPDPVALPRALALGLADCDERTRRLVRGLPGLLDAARERERSGETDGGGEPDGPTERERLERLVEQATGQRPERYYALLLLDGDRMGEWLAAGPPQARPSFGDCWHPAVRHSTRLAELRHANPALDAYLKAPRPASPARHAAISQALAAFSQELVRHIVEDLCKGMVLYAGGDDVMAMVAVEDLPRALWLLRIAYSGEEPARAADHSDLGRHDLRIKSGYVHLRGRLLRVMGAKASASAGAVIAHHTAPLGAVLGALRAAERTAKDAGRNRFCLRIHKRSGGFIELTVPWHLGQAGAEPASYTPMGLLLELRDRLASPELSRRAAYLAGAWLARLPVLSDGARLRELLAATLAHQLHRQGESTRVASEIGTELAVLAVALNGTGPSPERPGLSAAGAWLSEFIATAEFLAREGRSTAAPGRREEAADG